MRIGVQTTSKCNFTCGHCMFTCSYKGVDMSDEIVARIDDLIDGEDLFEINYFGGEPFLNIHHFDRIYRTLYRPGIHTFVSSNGTFINSKAHFNYVAGLCAEFGDSNYSEERISIRISNTFHHQLQHSNRMMRKLHLFKNCMGDPEAFYDWFRDDFDVEMRYPVFHSPDYEPLVFIDKQGHAHDRMNPSGRALRNELYDKNHILYCFLRSDGTSYSDFKECAVDHAVPQFMADGRVGLCCYCDSGSLGHVLDFESMDEIYEAAHEFREQFRKKFPIEHMKQSSICSACRKFKMDKRRSR